MSDGKQTGAGTGPNQISERINHRQSRGNARNIIDTERAQEITTIKDGILAMTIENAARIGWRIGIATTVQLIDYLYPIENQFVILRPYNQIAITQHPDPENRHQ